MEHKIKTDDTTVAQFSTTKDRGKFTCLVGETDLKDFTSLWEGHQPSNLILFALAGRAELKLPFATCTLVPRRVLIVAPDMFPHVVAATSDFRAFFVLCDRDFSDDVLYDVPDRFYDSLYVEPSIEMAADMPAWINLFRSFHDDVGHAYRNAILADLLHAFVLHYYDAWLRQKNGRQIPPERRPAYRLCSRFYNLLFDHFLEHHDTAFYANKLCVTPTYLAQVLRRLCQETPKEAIDRMVVLELKYMLRHTAMTNKQMAAHLHFADTSYMGRFFRRKTGLSLTEYRRKP